MLSNCEIRILIQNITKLKQSLLYILYYWPEDDVLWAMNFRNLKIKNSPVVFSAIYFPCNLILKFQFC